MTALAVAIDQFTTPIQLSAPLDIGSYLAPYTIDSECILVSGGDNSVLVSVLRGQNGTAPASHTAGTTLTAGWGAGAISPLTADLDAAGHRITNLPDPVDDGEPATKSYVLVPIAEADPGAIGAGRLWLQTNAAGVADDVVQLNIRNLTNDGWIALGAFETTGTYWSVFAPDGSSFMELDNNGGFVLGSGNVPVPANMTFQAASVSASDGSGATVIFSAGGGKQASVDVPGGQLHIVGGGADGTPGGLAFEGRIGFFGATRVVQQATPVTLGDVIALLQAYGLAAP